MKKPSKVSLIVSCVSFAVILIGFIINLIRSGFMFQATDCGVLAIATVMLIAVSENYVERKKNYEAASK